MARRDPRESLKALQRQDPLPEGMARVRVESPAGAYEGLVPVQCATMVVAILETAARLAEEQEKPEEPPP